MDEPPSDTLGLILRHGAGDLSETGAAELSRRLRDDPAARALMCDLALEAIAVSDLAAPRDEVGIPASASAGRTPRSVFPWWLAAAALLMLLLSTSLWMQHLARVAGIVHVSEVTGGIRWTGGAGRIVEPVSSGKDLPGGTLELLSDDATAKLVFRDGSTIILDGPSSATLSDRGQKQVHLREGSLSASIRKQKPGRPFLITTPTARLEVLGTRFSVDSAAATTLLSVDEGAVRLTRLVDGSVTDVSAEHAVEATLNDEEALLPVRRQEPSLSWTSDLSQGGKGCLGEWRPSTPEAPARLRAEPHLVTSDRKAPVPIYRVACSIPGAGLQTLQLRPGSAVRVTGRVEKPGRVVVMLSTKELRGGFAGNFFVTQLIGSDGSFELTLPASSFARPSGRSGIDGLQLRKVHLYTMKRDIGLELEQVEILPPTAQP